MELIGRQSLGGGMKRFEGRLMVIVNIRCLERSLIQRAEIELFTHGHINHTRGGNTILYERDIDRELAIPFDELLGAI